VEHETECSYKATKERSEEEHSGELISIAYIDHGRTEGPSVTPDAQQSAASDRT